MKPSVLLLFSVLLLCAATTPRATESLSDGSGNIGTHCAKFTTVRIPAAAIGLPTSGVAVTAARLVAAPTAGQTGHDYCLVSGVIKPVDPWAPDIHFQIALPSVWNRKAVMLGGGAFDGSPPDVAGKPLNAPIDAPTPLARGYAVFGSDSGHQGPPVDGSFLLNQEAYRNWLGDALKKTRDAAVVVIRIAYGSRPDRSYFLGGSTGGREALTVAGRWPADWDGVVALYPSRFVTATILGLLHTTQAFAKPGAFLDRNKRELLYRAALQQCDALDGARDGIISNVRGCNATFLPKSALVDGVPLRCTAGADHGDDCLSDPQIAALEDVNDPFPFRFSLATGQSSFPGYNILISDSGRNLPSPLEAVVATMQLGNTPGTFPVTPNNSLSAQLTDQFIRFAVARSGLYDQLTLDVSNPAQFSSRLAELSRIDAEGADLAPFAAHGGKVLILQGTEDLLVSPRLTEQYYHQLRSKMGNRVDSFLRYYEVAGFGHAISTTFNVSWDQLSALENWVENGIDPGDDQTIADTVGVPGRTRPLCRFPKWPKYNGSGDVNKAASFTCAAE